MMVKGSIQLANEKKKKKKKKSVEFSRERVFVINMSLNPHVESALISSLVVNGNKPSF